MSLTLLNLDSNNFSGEPPPLAPQTVSAHILHGQDAVPICTFPEMTRRSLPWYGTELPDAGGSGALPELTQQRISVQLPQLSPVHMLASGLPDAWRWGRSPGAAHAGAELAQQPVCTLSRLSPSRMLAGGLPDAWGAPGAFPNLRTLALKRSGLQGPLPPAWGNSSDALPALTILTIDSNNITGPLPATWSRGFASLS